jgi:hypothetical protein
MVTTIHLRCHSFIAFEGVNNFIQIFIYVSDFYKPSLTNIITKILIFFNLSFTRRVG